MITQEYFEFLDFWFYVVGVNVCPADTRNKRISDNWKVRQSEPMSPDEFEAMKKEGAYIRGAAVVTGKVWRGNYVGYYLNGVDLDNQKAIEEICNSYNAGKPVTPGELAEQTLVEMHEDDKNKMHMYVYSKHPFKNKTSDVGRAWFDRQTMPSIEVKGTKSLMFCTPSMHKGGHRYSFIKQRPPSASENLEQKINETLSKYGINYLLTSDKKVRDYQRKRDSGKTINEGSRHNELLREMNSRLHEFIKKKPLEEIKQMLIAYNNLFCRPPMEYKEFEQIWNDSVIHVIEKEGEGRQNIAVELISVADAKRRSFGRVAVKGMIVGISSVEHAIMATKFSCSNCGVTEGPIEHKPPLFSVPDRLSLNSKPSKCISCGEYTYRPSEHQDKPAIKIQLQDEEKQNQLENLDVILFDNDTLNVRNGERAMIFGGLHIVQQNRNSKRVTYLFANSEGGGIEYERPENEIVVISEEDHIRLNEFAQQSDMKEKLTAMIAPTVIGHEDKKLAIILMYIGAPETEDFRGRIHGLFIGPPGTAKTKLARAAKKLGEPQSRYSSTQGASGKSITAMIDKDGDSYVLRLGVLPQARNSMCILNEVSSLSMEDQRHLFDVMEEGFLTIDKYAFHREIGAPTTVLGTTNPEGGEWYHEIVEKGKIPLRKELLDRYDLVMVFQSLKDKEKKLEYAKKKLKLLRRNEVDRVMGDLEFLRKVIQHAKTFNPRLSEEAEAMIIEYWSSLDIKIFPTNRLLETIVRLSKAFARMHFSDEVNVAITRESLVFITRMLKDFDSSVEVVEDPRNVACFAVAEFLMKTPNMPFKFSDCVDYAITSYKLVEAYLGESPVNTDSHKYRDLRERFLQSSPVANGLISIESYNPLTLVFKVQKNVVKEDV